MRYTKYIEYIFWSSTVYQFIESYQATSVLQSQLPDKLNQIPLYQ